ncbi:MAG: hypothetical protein ACTSQY_07895 [Candidatus Odinarchaeia archaeon]
MSENEYKKVINELKEYIFRNHKLPSTSEISELCSISYDKCTEICNKLEGQKQIYTISGGGHGKPRIIIPYNMMESIFNTQPSPEWIKNEKYAFSELEELEKKNVQITEKINNYKKLQFLLYGTDIPLEKSIEYTLNYLGFKDVVHHIDNSNYADITFLHNGIKYLIEVEGTTKKGNKEKVLQLEGWIGIDIENGIDYDKLKGMFIINHNRDDSPENRDEPLTYHAKQYMKRYGFILLTTKHLFEIIKKVYEKEITKNDAKNIIIKGEKIE